MISYYLLTSPKWSCQLAAASSSSSTSTITSPSSTLRMFQWIKSNMNSALRITARSRNTRFRAEEKWLGSATLHNRILIQIQTLWKGDFGQIKGRIRNTDMGITTVHRYRPGTFYLPVLTCSHFLAICSSPGHSCPSAVAKKQNKSSTFWQGVYILRGPKKVLQMVIIVLFINMLIKLN